MATQAGVRRTRARSPFLLSAPATESTDWWQEMCLSVGSWLNNNPLRLGIDDDSLDIVTSQIKRGNVPNVSEDIRRKAWLHIDVEFDGVPGNPMDKFKEMAEAAGLKSPSRDSWSPRTQLSNSSRQLSGKLQTLISNSSSAAIVGADPSGDQVSSSREQEQDVSDALTALMKSTSTRDNTGSMSSLTANESPSGKQDTCDDNDGVEEEINENKSEAGKETLSESNNRRLSQLQGNTGADTSAKKNPTTEQPKSRQKR
jgi:hypothetical protein